MPKLKAKAGELLNFACSVPSDVSCATSSSIAISGKSSTITRTVAWWRSSTLTAISKRFTSACRDSVIMCFSLRVPPTAWFLPAARARLTTSVVYTKSTQLATRRQSATGCTMLCRSLRRKSSPWISCW